MRYTSAVAGVLAAASVASADIKTISAVGNKFFDSDGDQFFLKGIAYQLSEDDPLIDEEQCTRDATLMSTLGANCIRVYHVDAKANHDGCMAAFAKVGIYTLIDLDTFDTYILSPTMADARWNQTQYDHYSAVMDAFASYDNVLGFFVGNENIAQADESLAAPYIKAAARDMKAYRDKKNYRSIPIGYSAADIAELRPMLQDYLTCGDDAANAVDFFALNSYEWCDVSSYETSGYATLEAQAKDFPVPIFFSETGCNVPGPRLFDDQTAIFGSNMVNDWSGSIIYEWIQEANNYGLIAYAPGDVTAVGASIVRSGTPTPVAPDFTNLKSQWATLTPTGVKSKDYDPKSVSSRACPASTASGWLVDGDVSMPTLGDSAAIHTSGQSGSTATATGTHASSTVNRSATGSVTGSATGSSASTSSTSASSAPALGRDVVFTGGVFVAAALVALWL